MADWLESVHQLSDLESKSRTALSMLNPVTIRSGTVVFRPGQPTENFPIIISGRIGVYLTGATGRDILLYSVSPGETCVQTTLGLLGGDAYSAEALAETDIEAVIVSQELFEQLLAESAGFRSYVFGAFARRMQTVMRVLESVAFVRVEVRLAEALLERTDSQGRVIQTHQELATAIGSVREVVSRRLEHLAKHGLVELERGQICVVDRVGLRRLVDSPG